MLRISCLVAGHLVAGSALALPVDTIDWTTGELGLGARDMALTGLYGSSAMLGRSFGAQRHDRFLADATASREGPFVSASQPPVKAVPAHYPKPGPWSMIASTFGLALFVFVRRLN